MAIDNLTINYSIPVPSFNNDVAYDFPRLCTALDVIDEILFLKADKSNTYTKSEVESIAATILTATSTSNVAIGTGSKTFTTQANKQFSVGQWLVISSSVNPANFMFGQVTSYSTTMLVVNVVVVSGSGTLASWNISISGIQGLQGVTGAQGATGATGAAGTNGAVWYSGSGAPAAGTGANNDYYFRTDTSDIYKKAAGAWGSPIANIKGATGATGATGSQGVAGANGINGATWLSGTSPTGGVDGDYYFKTDTCDIYKKVAGSWGSPIVNIKGADGAGGGSPTYTLQNKTAGYAVAAGDLGTIINCTANSFTVSLGSAATLGVGFHCSIRNSSDMYTHVITVDPAGTETIDGKPTLVLRRGEGFDIFSDGSNWQIDNKKPMRGYAENCSANTTRASALGSSSVAVGDGAGANGSNSVALGYVANAGGIGSVALGYGSNAAGNYSFAAGYNTNAYGNYSFALGNYSRASQHGKYAYATGYFSTSGDAQAGTMVLRAATTATTTVILTSDGAAASTTDQLILANGQAMAIQGTLIAKQQNSGNMAAYNIVGAVSNNAGTMAVTGLALTLIGTDSIVLDTAPTITVDNTNKGVTITSGAKSATNIKWVATLNTSEVTY